MAFILVQHLAPNHESHLSEIIRRHTFLQVFEVENAMTVQPNCVYVIPPNYDMAILHGVLELIAAPRGPRYSIDFFFRSLALDQKENAIGIILSGTGTDGTVGARAIKAEGGLVLAQEDASVEFDGMPRSAIAAGFVDFALPANQMVAQLIATVSDNFGPPTPPATPGSSTPVSALIKLCALVRDHTGHDFSLYKSKSIQRRIERRMTVNQLATLDAYFAFASQKPAELDALFQDMLIGVTNFFRDPDAFQVLEEQILPRLIAGRLSGAPIRVWSAGCSTGEEAYSLAILLVELREASKQKFAIQVFATDIDARAIAVARTGRFSPSIAADISANRLARFFTLEPDGAAYKIDKDIRDLLIFSEHDIARDPPFSKLDVISCRNLLIYMGAELHKKLIRMFHLALNPNGCLFLGTSETVGEFGERFGVVDSKWKLFQRKPDLQRPRGNAVSRFLQAPIPPVQPAAMPGGKFSPFPRRSLREVTEQALLFQFVSAGALVNARGDILYLHGRTGLYLEPQSGEAGINNIVKMAREGLRPELVSSLRRSAESNEIVHHPALLVKTNGHFSLVKLTVSPVAAPSAADADAKLFLVTLQDGPPLVADSPAPPPPPPASSDI